MSGIYIHIPFCEKKCRYCDFFSRVPSNQQIFDDYINALCKETELRKDYLESKKINTIYFGGGTPSMLKINHLNDIFEQINKYFEIQDNYEITFELNPDDINEQYIADLKKYTPINRLSIGFQSFFEDDLEPMNRRHKTEANYKSVEIAKKSGFSNISGDLIYALPNQTLEKWEYNLKQFFSLGIQHLSAYNLTIEDGTVFGSWKRKGRIHEIDEELSLLMFKKLIDKSTENGFVHYEISNFSLPNFEAKHNSSYWTGEKYLGLGTAAHSYNKNSRQWNVPDINEYIEYLNLNKLPSVNEILSDTDKFNELIMTGLRTKKGIKIDTLKNNFSEFYKSTKPTIEHYQKQQLIKIENNSYVLTEIGLFLSDSIISDLMIV